MVKLSVLVCSIPERLKEFSVVEKLCEQAAQFDDVEVLYLGDNKRINLGAKRNMLLDLASGQYVVHVDDDDEIADDYIESIRAAADENSDVICFKALYSRDGVPVGDVDYSMEHEARGTCRPNGGRLQYLRWPNDKTATSRELASTVRFGDSADAACDLDFAIRLRPLVKTETQIDKCLYFYNWTSLHSMTSESAKR